MAQAGFEYTIRNLQPCNCESDALPLGCNPDPTIIFQGHVKAHFPGETVLADIYLGSKYVFLILEHLFRPREKPDKNR